MNERKIKEIAERLPIKDLRSQLAEECTEFAKAYLKYQRCIDGTNPVRSTKEELHRQMLEEIADVMVSLEVLVQAESEEANDIIRETRQKKIDRWRECFNSSFSAD